MIHPNADPLMRLVQGYNDQTLLTPQMPFGPLVHVPALELAADPSADFAVADIPRVPDMLGEAHFAEIRSATTAAHQNRRFYIPTDHEQRRAFGFVTTSIVTAAGELAKGDNGVKLSEIHKPGENDPQIAAGVEYLQDEYNRGVFLSIGQVGASILDLPGIRRQTATYRADITRTARLWGSPEPGSPDFFAKIDALSLHRAAIAEHLARALRRRLFMQQEHARFGDDPQFPALAGLSYHELNTVAHNLSRWRPNDDWFRQPKA